MVQQFEGQKLIFINTTKSVSFCRRVLPSRRRSVTQTLGAVII